MQSKCPCVMDCPDRTSTCKRTCEKFIRYEKSRMEMYEAKKNKFEAMEAADPAKGEARQRMLRKYVRRKLRKERR